MNKEYIYVNGKVVIQDENGNKRLVDYNNNLDEILVQENLIENLEKNISKLELQKKCFEKIKNKKRYIPWFFIIMFICLSIGLPLYINLLIELAGAIWNNTITMVYLFLCTIGIWFAISIELSEFKKFKGFKKNAKGVEKALEYARIELVSAKAKLERLNNTNTITKANSEVKVVKVNDIEKLTELQENIQMFFNLGYNDETKENQLVLKKKK